jgi:hypothetical protein
MTISWNLCIYIVLMTSLSICLSPASQAGNSKDHYDSNIDKAKDINAKCNSDMKEAISNKDKDTIIYIHKDGECRNAKNAIVQHERSINANIFMKEEEGYLVIFKQTDINSYMNEEILCLRSNSDGPKCTAFYKLLPFRKNEYISFIENKNDNDLNTHASDACQKNTSSSLSCKYASTLRDQRQLQKIKAKVSSMSYHEYFNEESECNDPKSLTCDYLKSILDYKKESYIQEKISHDVHSDLYQQKDEFCFRRNGTLCKLHRKINRILLDDTIAKYLANSDRLKVDLGRCLDNIQHYEKLNDNDKLREVKNTLTCKSAIKASKNI